MNLQALQSLFGGQQQMPMDDPYQTQMAYQNAQMDKQRAQDLMNAQYTGGGGLGIAAVLLQALRGRALNRQADETASQALKKQFEFDNKAAMAEAEKKAREDDAKFQKELEKIRTQEAEKAKYRSKSEFDYLPEDQKARAARIKAGLELGAQAPQAPQRVTYGAPIEVMGADGKPVLVRPGSDGSMVPVNGFAPRPQAGNVPAGYQATPDGKLAFIPGGPADPANKGSAVGQEAQNKLALIDNAIANAKEYAKRVLGPNGQFKDIDARMGDTPGLLQSAIQDQLYVKSGASAPVEEVKKWEGIYGPGVFEKDTTASAKVAKLIADLERQRAGILGQNNAAPAAQGGWGIQRVD
jgi:hypothetical protein